jgi:hypothetical protein
MKVLCRSVLVLLLLCVESAFAQAHYTTTLKYSLQDNTANCYTHNCFLQTALSGAGGNVALIQITTAFDATVYGIDAAGSIWSIPQANGSQPYWSKQTAMGSGYKGIVARSAKEIYALYSNTSLCPTGYAIKWWDGTAWHNISSLNYGCAFGISITNDGTLTALGEERGLWYTTTPSAPNWKRVGSGTYSLAGALSSTSAYALQGNTLYQINLSTAAVTLFTGAPQIKSFTVTADGFIFAVTPSNTVYIYNSNDATPAWKSAPGTLTAIFGANQWNVFGLNGTTPYHFLGVALGADVNINGYFDCSIFINSGCPAGSYHTAKATAGFTGGYTTGNTATASGYPSNTLNATAHDTSAYCDGFYGDPSSPYCIIQQANGNVDCSEMGGIVAQNATGGGSPFMGSMFGTGEELVRNTSGPNGYVCGNTKPFGFATLCNYHTTPSCTNVPTYPITDMLDRPPMLLPSWWVTYKCVAVGTAVQTCWAKPFSGLQTTDPGPEYCANP